MYKILIVDDEKIVRIAMRNIIQWENLGVEFFGEAKDGFEALAMIKKNMPDIIITDLKMPNMDGIELIKQLNHEQFEGKILVLSNYDDFQLVRDAMKLGAVDYILKVTMKVDDFRKSITQIVASLDKEKVLKKQKVKKNIELRQGHTLLKQKFLKQLVTEKILDVGSYSSKIDELGLHISKEKNIIVLIKVDNMKKAIETGKIKDKNLLSFCIKNIIAEIIENKISGEIFDLEQNKFILILSIESDDKISIIKNQVIKKISDMISLYMNLTVSMVISEVIDINEIPYMLRDCKKYIEYKFYSGNNSIMYFRDIDKIYKESNFSLDYSTYINDMTHFMDLCQTQVLKISFKKLIDEAENNKVYPDNLKKSINILIANLESILLQNKVNDIFELEVYKNRLNNSEYIKEYRENVNNLLEIMSNKLKNTRSSHDKYEINEIVSYIKRNIDKRVTLKMIAENIHLSPSYISRLFKKEKGINVIDYCNMLKIKKSKQLLREPEVRIKEVAEKVGITDQFYFNKVFKKYSGISPTEYKKKLNDMR